MIELIYSVGALVGFWFGRELSMRKRILASLAWPLYLLAFTVMAFVFWAAAGSNSEEHRQDGR